MADRTHGEALRRAAVELRASPTPLLDARTLLMRATGREHAELIAAEREPLSAEAATAFRALVARRAGGEPVSQILGEREFYGRNFAVSRDVLTPRPETEMLVDAALETLPEGGRVLDVGTGSGCLLVSVLAERGDASGTGIDISERALGIARRNVSAHDVGRRARLEHCDLAEYEGGPFDLVLSNPPYIEEGAALPVEVAGHEPAIALFAGPDGLDAYRALARRLPLWLAEGGTAAVEIGTGQGEAVAAILTAPLARTHAAELRRDLAGHDRMVILRPKAR
ncbi:peptide chain release factor N(5)-glutamine methyltransferase [Parvularcula oceani]|uniref:peptide chain release factor N(5)-glutamine methyltransferase n=1 Tax=Parvularcula oceani TaxID=1247963 RepID=UPI0004E17434|nr:peptide chain release factor N(5)-glutamine methyltransferase [Parvularcula oceani]